MATPNEPMSWSQKRKAARERRTRIRERRPDVGTNDVVVRQISQPIRLPSVNSDLVAPILAPDRMVKDTDGRCPPRGLVKKLRGALGVYALCAYHSLSVLYDDSERSRDDVVKAAGMSFGHLRRIGAASISEFTLFDTEEQVLNWAKAKYRDLPAGAEIANNRLRAETELSAVALLGKTYVRAQRIIAGWDEAQAIQVKAGDGAARAKAEQQAHDVIEEAYRSAWHDLSIGQLTEIAIYADINPVILWPQHITYFTEPFELARFVGCVNAGIEAKLPAALHELTRLVLAGHETGDARDQVSRTIRHHLSSAFPDNQLVEALEAAERDGLVVLIGRGSRRIGFVGMPVVEPQFMGRRQQVLTALKSGFTYGARLAGRLFGNAQ